MRQVRFWAAVAATSAVCGFGGATVGVLVLREDLRGPAGAQGPTGQTGPTGARGPIGPVGPAGPEPALPPEAGTLSWSEAYNDLAQRIATLESGSGRPADCTPMKVVTRIENEYDPLAATTSGPIGITAYTGYACAAY